MLLPFQLFIQPNVVGDVIRNRCPIGASDGVAVGGDHAIGGLLIPPTKRVPGVNRRLVDVTIVAVVGRSDGDDAEAVAKELKRFGKDAQPPPNFRWAPMVDRLQAA